MSTGPAVHEGAGPAPARAGVLARLEAERRQAEGCYAWDRERELREQIAQMSAGTPVSPARETTSHPARKRNR